MKAGNTDLRETAIATIARLRTATMPVTGDHRYATLTTDLPIAPPETATTGRREATANDRRATMIATIDRPGVKVTIDLREATIVTIIEKTDFRDLLLLPAGQLLIMERRALLPRPERPTRGYTS